MTTPTETIERRGTPRRAAAPATCYYCGDDAQGAVSEWVAHEGALFERLLPTCPFCGEERRRALAADEGWRRLEGAPPPERSAP